MTLDRDAFASKANTRYEKSREFWRNWRGEAKDSFSFIAGKQWEQEDEAILNEQRRPPITFNYSEKMVDAVVGAEVSNRQEVHYNPRGMEDAPVAEVFNAAVKWVRDECNAEDEESDAFRDALICGIGWTWTHMDYETDPDGKINEDRIDPLEMFPDPAASKPGLMDRRWNDRVYWADEEAVRAQWPDAIFPEDDQNKSTGVVKTGHRYDEDSDDGKDRHEGQVQLRLHECYELEDVYRVASGNEIVTLSGVDFARLKPQIKQFNLPYAKQKKRVYYRAFFAGETLLDVAKSPCQTNFTFQAITGKRDRNANVWYGLTRVMKDPQRWANKWLSQILHIINTNAKGGLMAEVGAFLDPVKAQEEWSNPDSITLFNEGAISGKKVIQKQAANYPSGLDKLMEFALGSLPMVTGINLEALGLANRDQAGVLEQQRKQAAYGLLSPFFDSLRRYRKEQGRVLLYYIHNYISDGRLVRIGGPELQNYVPLTKQPDIPKFDLIVDQSPNAPDTKDKTWQTLESIIPSMIKEGMPIPPDVLDYTPLPSSLVMKWKQFIQSQQQVDAQAQEQIQQLEQENSALKQDQQIKMQELDFEKQKAVVEMQNEQQKMMMQLQLKREEVMANIQLEREKAQAEFDLARQQHQQDMELARTQATQQADLAQQKVDNDHEAKMAAAKNNPSTTD